jgi:hypothetical protein
MQRTQWQKGNGVVMSQLLSALPRMKLSTSRSAYWRHRPKGKGGVPAEAEGCSSIEALWFVCKEVRIRPRRCIIEGGPVVSVEWRVCGHLCTVDCCWNPAPLSTWGSLPCTLLALTR